MISAVNGDLWLDNIYCFRYRVKLNNPLMGTETRYRVLAERLSCVLFVKLNNPLMGTETQRQYKVGTLARTYYMLN